MPTITLTLTDHELAQLRDQATAARFGSVHAWAKRTLLEIAQAQAAIRELDRKKKDARARK